MESPQPSRIQINDVLWFKLVAERGSVHRAAPELGVSQPAVSKAIRRLETSLGLNLFERTARGMLLTEAGRTIYARALEIADWTLGVSADVVDLKAANTGLLRVGVVPALVQALLIPAAKAMIGSNRLSLHVQLSDVLFRLLGNGEIDCAIAALGPDVSREFNYQILGRQRSLVVGKANHPLQRRAFVAAELADHDWVLPPKHIVLRQWIDRFLADHAQLGSAPAIEVDATPAILAPLIEVTDLLTVLTEDALGSSICRKLRALPEPAPVWSIDICIFWRRTAQFGPLMERFRELAVDAYSAKHQP